MNDAISWDNKNISNITNVGWFMTDRDADACSRGDRRQWPQGPLSSDSAFSSSSSPLRPCHGSTGDGSWAQPLDNWQRVLIMYPESHLSLTGCPVSASYHLSSSVSPPPDSQQPPASPVCWSSRIFQPLKYLSLWKSNDTFLLPKDMGSAFSFSQESVE